MHFGILMGRVVCPFQNCWYDKFDRGRVFSPLDALRESRSVNFKQNWCLGSSLAATQQDTKLHSLRNTNSYALLHGTRVAGVDSLISRRKRQPQCYRLEVLFTYHHSNNLPVLQHHNSHIHHITHTNTPRHPRSKNTAN